MNQPLLFISKQLLILPWRPRSFQLPVFISELPVKSVERLWLRRVCEPGLWGLECGFGAAPAAAAPCAAFWDNPAGSCRLFPAPQGGWEPRRVPLSLPAVPPQQLLFLAGMLKSRLLPGILISHLPLSGGIFPGCNYFYLQADKNYPALELGRVLCVLKQLLSSPVKTQKNGEVSFPCAVI